MFTELQLQKKWKSIRDSFQKYVQNPNRTRRPYIYTKQLQFLFKNTTPPPPQADGGASSDSDDTARKSKSKVWKFKKRLKLAKDSQESSEEDDDDNNDNNDNSDQNEESREYLNEETNFAEIPIKIRKISNTDDFAFANVDAQPKNDGEDPDKLFLLSLLPHLKAVPEESRLNVKMDLMQVLRNASYAASRDQKIF